MMNNNNLKLTTAINCLAGRRDKKCVVFPSDVAFEPKPVSFTRLFVFFRSYANTNQTALSKKIPLTFCSAFAIACFSLLFMGCETQEKCVDITGDSNSIALAYFSQSLPSMSTNRMDRGWRIGGRIYATQTIDGTTILINEGQSRFDQAFSGVTAYHNDGENGPRSGLIRYQYRYWPMGVINCESENGETRLAVYMVNNSSMFYPNEDEDGDNQDMQFPWKIEIEAENQIIVIIQWEGQDDGGMEWLNQEGIRFESAESGFSINSEGFILTPGSIGQQDYYFPFKSEGL